MSLRARIGYRRAARAAGRHLRRAEQETGAVVARVDAQTRALMQPRQLARYGPFALYDDSLRGPDWEVSLPSVRAHLVEPGAVTLQGGGPDLATVPPPLHHPEREHLVVSGRRGVSAVECRTGDEQAGRFAKLVNVAALNSSRLDRRRRAAVAASAEQLEQTRAWALQRIGEARADQQRIVSDRRQVERADEALAHARLDTAELQERRQRLAAAKRQLVEARAAAGRPPRTVAAFARAAVDSGAQLSRGAFDGAGQLARAAFDSAGRFAARIRARASR